MSEVLCEQRGSEQCPRWNPVDNHRCQASGLDGDEREWFRRAEEVLLHLHAVEGPHRPECGLCRLVEPQLSREVARMLSTPGSLWAF